MKSKIKAIAAILAACVIIACAVFAVREYKARIPVITVKDNNLLTVPGDTVDTNELIDVQVKGEYECKCKITVERECCDLDENGILRILYNGQTAMDTIILTYTATGSANKSSDEDVFIIVQNPISENNSYEASVSDVSFRVYNNLKDQGNGVFKRGEGIYIDDYEITFHSVDNVSDIYGLEAEIKRYAKEKYLFDEERTDYRSEDVVLDSGKKARKISFTAIRSEGKYMPKESGGLMVLVTIYAFGEDGRYFFIDDDNSWGSGYEMDQIANTVE